MHIRILQAMQIGPNDSILMLVLQRFQVGMQYLRDSNEPTVSLTVSLRSPNKNLI